MSSDALRLRAMQSPKVLQEPFLVNLANHVNKKVKQEAICMVSNYELPRKSTSGNQNFLEYF